MLPDSIYHLRKFLFIDEIIISQNRNQVNPYPVNNRKYPFYIAKCLSAKRLAFFICRKDDMLIIVRRLSTITPSLLESRRFLLTG